MNWFKKALTQAAKSTHLRELENTALALRAMPGSEYDDVVCELLISVGGLFDRGDEIDRVGIRKYFEGIDDDIDNEFDQLAVGDDLFRRRGDAPRRSDEVLRKLRDELAWLDADRKSQGLYEAESTRRENIRRAIAALTSVGDAAARAHQVDHQAGNLIIDWWTRFGESRSAFDDRQFRSLATGAALTAAIATIALWGLLSAATALTGIDTPLFSLSGVFAIAGVVVVASVSAICCGFIMVPALDRAARWLILVDLVMVALTMALVAQAIGFFSNLPLIEIASASSWQSWLTCFVGPVALGSGIARLLARLLQPIPLHPTRAARWAIVFCAGAGSISATIFAACAAVFVMRDTNDGNVALALLAIPFIWSAATVAVLRESRTLNVSDLSGSDSAKWDRAKSPATAMAMAIALLAIIIARPVYVQQVGAVTDLFTPVPVTVGEQAELRSPTSGDILVVLLRHVSAGNQNSVPDLVLIARNGLSSVNADDPEIARLTPRDARVDVCVRLFDSGQDCSGGNKRWLGWLFGVPNVALQGAQPGRDRVLLTRPAQPQRIAAAQSGTFELTSPVLDLTIGRPVSLRIRNYRALDAAFARGLQRYSMDGLQISPYGTGALNSTSVSPAQAAATAAEAVTQAGVLEDALAYSLGFPDGKDWVFPVVLPGRYYLCRSIMECANTPRYAEIPALADSLIVEEPWSQSRIDSFFSSEVIPMPVSTPGA